MLLGGARKVLAGYYLVYGVIFTPHFTMLNLLSSSTAALQHTQPETFPRIPCKFADWPEIAISDPEIAIDETQAEGSVHLIPHASD